MAKLSILYVTHQFPHDKTFGGQLRTLQMARLLRRCGRLTLVVVPLEGSVERDALSKTREEFELCEVFQFVPWPIEGLHGRCRHEFDPWYLNTDGKRLLSQDSDRLQRLIAAHDVTWFRGSVTPNGTGIPCWTRSVLDVDDVASRYHWSVARSRGSVMRRIMALRRCWFCRRREGKLLERFSILGVCSEEDRSYLGGIDRIHVIPNGFEVSGEALERTIDGPVRVGFIGTLRHPPNSEGLNWFTGVVWPLIKKEVKAARLRLVGAGTDELRLLESWDIDGLGWVKDTSAEIASWSLMVVPILSGGGTRIKIAEGFARKCPVVSTRMGAFGYDVTSGEELLIADGAKEFASACVEILLNEKLGIELSERAWDKYRQKWTWDAIAPKVIGAVEHCFVMTGKRGAQILDGESLPNNDVGSIQLPS